MRRANGDGDRPPGASCRGDRPRAVRRRVGTTGDGDRPREADRRELDAARAREAAVEPCGTRGDGPDARVPRVTPPSRRRATASCLVRSRHLERSVCRGTHTRETVSMSAVCVPRTAGRRQTPKSGGLRRAYLDGRSQRLKLGVAALVRLRLVLQLALQARVLAAESSELALGRLAELVEDLFGGCPRSRLLVKGRLEARDLRLGRAGGVPFGGGRLRRLQVTRQGVVTLGGTLQFLCERVAECVGRARTVAGHDAVSTRGCADGASNRGNPATLRTPRRRRMTRCSVDADGISSKDSGSG